MNSKVKKTGNIMHVGKKHIEEVSSEPYLIVSLISMAAALGFKYLRRKHPAFIVGEWVAPFLIMALYNKVKK